MTDREPAQATGATAYPPSRRADAGSTTPDYSVRPVAFRGPDTLGGLLLVLAGIAAGISLLLGWLAGRDVSGWSLVRAGFEDPGAIVGDGRWQPLAIVLGGGVLLVLGLLMALPMRTHRTLGFLALLVTGAVAAAVLVPLAAEGWDLGFFGPGFWFGIAVAVLGLLGGVKALLTGPRYAR